MIDVEQDGSLLPLTNNPADKPWVDIKDWPAGGSNVTFRYSLNIRNTIDKHPNRITMMFKNYDSAVFVSFRKLKAKSYTQIDQRNNLPAKIKDPFDKGRRFWNTRYTVFKPINPHYFENVNRKTAAVQHEKHELN